MVLQLDGVATQIASTTSIVLNLVTSSTNPDLLYLFTGIQNGSNQKINTISASGTPNWTQRTNISGGNTVALESWYTITSGNFSNSITVTLSASTKTASVVFGVSGVNSSVPFDTNVSLPSIAYSSATTKPNDVVSTDIQNCMIIGGVAKQGTGLTKPDGTYILITAASTAGGTASTNVTTCTEYKIVNGTATNLIVDFSASASSAGALIADAINGRIDKNITQNLAVEGKRANIINKSINAFMITRTDLSKIIQKLITNSFNISSIFSIGAKVYTVTLTQMINIFGSLSETVNKQLSNLLQVNSVFTKSFSFFRNISTQLSIDSNLSKLTGKSVFSQLNITSSFQRVFTLARNLSQNITIRLALVKSITKSIGNYIGIQSSLQRITTYLRTLSGSLSIISLLSKTTSKMISSLLNIKLSSITSSISFRNFSNTIGITSALTKTTTKALSARLSISSSLQRIFSSVRLFISNIIIQSTLTTLSLKFLALANSIDIGSKINRIVTYIRLLNQNIGTVSFLINIPFFALVLLTEIGERVFSSVKSLVYLTESGERGFTTGLVENGRRIFGLVVTAQNYLENLAEHIVIISSLLRTFTLQRMLTQTIVISSILAHAILQTLVFPFRVMIKMTRQNATISSVGKRIKLVFQRMR